MDTRFTPGRNSHGSLSTLRQAADSAQMLVWMTDPDDVFTYLSCGASVLYGNGETLDMSAWSKLAHPEDMARVDALFRQAREARGEYRVEYRIKKSDGSSRRMMGCGAPRFSDSGEFQGYIGTFVDASDHHAAIEALATEELKKREQRFRSLTDLSTDWYWETDENDRFSFISEGVQRLFGAPAERLIGTTRADLATTLDQPGLLECFQQVSNREPFRNIRYAIKRSVMGMMRYTNISGEPVFENGVFKGYRGVGHDITADIEVAEQLAELAAENKALIANSPDIMLLLDHEGRILRVNEAVTDLIGYRPGELLGRHFLEFVVPDDAGKSMAATDELRRNNMMQDLENRWTRKDGRVAYLSWAIRWADDRKLMYATGRDVSESHRTRAELHKSRNSLVSMLESIGDAFFAMDRDWRITYANRKTAEFVGRTQQALIGKIVWDALPEMPGSSVFRVYRNAMATRKETFFEAYYEPADAWVEVRTYPYEDGLSVFFHDITARRQAESAIRDSEQRFREVIEMTPVGYLLTDAKGTLLAVNPALCSISGYSQEALVGQSIMTLFTTCPCDGALFAQGGAHAVHGREAVLNHAHGHPVYVLVNASIKRDGDGNGLSLTAFLTDITERKEAEANLEQLAKHDTLTGLPNRVLLNDHLQHMLGSARKNEAVAVMFIDLDRFKEVNDSMGHEPGDILLREVARRLQKNMRPSDIVARLGGDEFVVAAHCSNGTDSAAAIAEKLLSAIAAPVDIAGQEVFVGASIGISMFPHDGKTCELLFQNADTAMYRAKAAGRNGFRFFEAGMSVEAKTRMTLEQALRRALERDEFELMYQPRIDLKTMSVSGMEALIRWNHPQLGLVSPMQFIPIAEERGLIEPIGRWVLQQACAENRRLMDKFGRPLRVSVNLSARQLKCHDIVEQVNACLADAALPHHLLELELTESALIEDMEVSTGVLRKLKAQGILLAVDDFGTGYSGLAYLRRFPLDTLKLDRSFINHQTDAISNFRFIKAFVDLAHTLKLSVVAEGVETPETLQFLRDAMCDEAQGYLFAKPLPVKELEMFLSRLPATGLTS